MFGAIDTFKTLRYREYLAEKTAEWLHDQLSAIHPDYPRLLHYNKLTYGRVNAPEHQLRQIREAGFVDCSMIETNTVRFLLSMEK